MIFGSSLRRVSELGLAFVFTNEHAYLKMAEYFNELEDLDRIDWGILQRRDFKRDPDDPGKVERYQAEALIHRHMPNEALLGVVCHSEELADSTQRDADSLGLKLSSVCKPNWYFQ